MKFPEWTKPAFSGAALGAIALAIVGFSWGGWMTSSAAMEMSSKDTRAAVTSALLPYCVQHSKSDPNSADVMARMKKASAYRRHDIVADAGWATPLGAERSNSALAQACQLELSKDF